MHFCGYAVFKPDVDGNKWKALRADGTLVRAKLGDHPRDLGKKEVLHEQNKMLEEILPGEILEVGKKYTLRLCWLKLGPSVSHANQAAYVFELTRNAGYVEECTELIPERFLGLLDERKHFTPGTSRSFKTYWGQSGVVRHFTLTLVH
jgi:hypothetical protein